MAALNSDSTTKKHLSLYIKKAVGSQKHVSLHTLAKTSFGPPILSENITFQKNIFSCPLTALYHRALRETCDP